MRNRLCDKRERKPIVSLLDMASLIPKYKTLFTIIAVGLFLIELEIFAIAVMKSGSKSVVQILNDRGTVVQEIQGKRISDIDRRNFESLFGPLESYQVRLLTREMPFPFRAWFVAAVGIPVGTILLFAFIVTAYNALFNENREPRNPSDPDNHGKEPTSKLEKIVQQISRLNVFAIGFLVFLLVFLYWVVPNLLLYVGNVGLKTVLQYKWFFLAIVTVGFGIVAWIIYLRYLLAKKNIESRVKLEKMRLQLKFAHKSDSGVMQIDYRDTRDPDERKMINRDILVDLQERG